MVQRPAAPPKSRHFGAILGGRRAAAGGGRRRAAAQVGKRLGEFAPGISAYRRFRDLKKCCREGDYSCDMGRVEKRKYARGRWHSHGKLKRRQRFLLSFYHHAVRRGEKRKIERRKLLEKAYRKILLRQSNAIEQKLIRRLRRRFEKAFRHRVVSKTIMELTGTSLAHLRVHLEGQFKPGMTWENHGLYGWHIDHRRPVASFDLSDPRQQRECFHWTNLQPLWAKENRDKWWKVDSKLLT